MKRYLSILLALALAAPALTGCDNGLDEYPSDAPMPAPSDKFTTDIQFVSRLSDDALGSSEADYTALDGYIQGLGSSAWLTILDRADNGNLPALLGTAFDNDKWTAFAFNRIADKTSYQGSLLYFNRCLPDGAQGIPSGNGCRVTAINATLQGTRTDKNDIGEVTGTASVSFDVDFLTARFDTAEQIAAFGGRHGVLRSFYDAHMPLLMIGTVKNDLVGTLRSAVSIGTSYAIQVTEVAAGPQYTIFVLSEERFWGFHSVEHTALADGIEAYDIQVMW